MTLLAQLSDPHVVARGQLLNGGIDTNGLLANAINRVQRLSRPVDAVLVSGDLVDRGSEAEYEQLFALLAPLQCPVHLMIGNHDSRERLGELGQARGYLPARRQTGFLQYAVDLPGGLRLVALDSHAPRKPYGELCEERLAWLDDTLSVAPHQPTIVALHHPPFASGIAGMDGIALRHGRAELEAIVHRHPQVERLVCGHLHRSMMRRFGGTLALSAPSTAHQIHLDLNGLSDLAYTFEPPGFLLHELRADGLLTHQIVCGGDDTPRRY